MWIRQDDLSPLFLLFVDPRDSNVHTVLGVRRRRTGAKSSTFYSKIRELLRTPFNDSRVETFIGHLGIGSLTESTALFRRCEKAGLVEIDYDQEDYRPRVKGLTVRGRELLPGVGSQHRQI